jgi:hypothetical protein
MEFMEYINNNKFIKLKARLKIVEDILEDVCENNALYIDKSRFYKESLGINIYMKEGNILVYHSGLYTDPVKMKDSFDFYVMISYDTVSKRFFKKEIIVEGKNLNYFQEHIVDLIEKSIIILNHAKKMTLKIMLNWSL